MSTTGPDEDLDSDSNDFNKSVCTEYEGSISVPSGL